MSTPIIRYKVVRPFSPRKEDQLFKSVIMNKTDADNNELQKFFLPNRTYLGRVYPVKQWVQADPRAILAGFGLLVFTSYNEADEWAIYVSRTWNTGTTCVFEVEVENEMYLPLFKFLSGNIKLDIQVKDLYKTKTGYSRDHGWPKGTEMYERVKLIKEVGRCLNSG